MNVDRADIRAAAPAVPQRGSVLSTGSGRPGLRCLIVEDYGAPLGALAQCVAQAFPQPLLYFASALLQTRLMLSHLAPDLALLDLDLQPAGASWPQFLGEARRLAPGVRFVVVAANADDDRLLPALRAGAAGFVLRSDPPATLAARLRWAQAGVQPLLPGLAQQILKHFEGGAAGPDALTRGEREMLGWVATGDTLEGAAERLQLPAETVRRRVDGLYRRLGFVTTCAAATEATPP